MVGNSVVNSTCYIDETSTALRLGVTRDSFACVRRRRSFFFYRVCVPSIMRNCILFTRARSRIASYSFFTQFLSRSLQSERIFYDGRTAPRQRWIPRSRWTRWSDERTRRFWWQRKVSYQPIIHFFSLSSQFFLRKIITNSQNEWCLRQNPQFQSSAHLSLNDISLQVLSHQNLWKFHFFIKFFSPQYLIGFQINGEHEKAVIFPLN